MFHCWHRSGDNTFFLVLFFRFVFARKIYNNNFSSFKYERHWRLDGMYIYIIYHGFAHYLGAYFSVRFRIFRSSAMCRTLSSCNHKTRTCISMFDLISLPFRAVNQTNESIAQLGFHRMWAQSMLLTLLILAEKLSNMCFKIFNITAPFFTTILLQRTTLE